MATNIVYLPGFLGSHLGYPVSRFLPPRRLWLDAPAAVSGQITRLQLADDGYSPGPPAGGITSGPLGVLGECYGPLASYMRLLGWTVLTVPYDWRLSVQRTAPLVATAAVAAYGDQPFTIVAHSLGSLVARLAWQQLAGQGRDAQVQRIVTLGAPHWGCWEAVRLLFGLPLLFRGIAFLAGIQGLLPGGDGPLWLDALTASWPAVYELLPWRDSGPLHDTDPATAARLYQSGTYLAGNAFVTQARLDAAAATQAALATAIPAGRMVSIQGTGFDTAVDFREGGDPLREDGYTYSNQGDDEVGQAYGSLPAVPNVYVYSPHMFLPLHPAVWAALPSAVSGGVTADVVQHA